MGANPAVKDGWGHDVFDLACTDPTKCALTINLEACTSAGTSAPVVTAAVSVVVCSLEVVLTGLPLPLSLLWFGRIRKNPGINPALESSFECQLLIGHARATAAAAGQGRGGAPTPVLGGDDQQRVLTDQAAAAVECPSVQESKLQIAGCTAKALYAFNGEAAVAVGVSARL